MVLFILELFFFLPKLNDLLIWLTKKKIKIW